MKPINIASCIIVDDYGRILLLHHDDGDASFWELPGGPVDEAEDPEAAALRYLSQQLQSDGGLIGSLGSEIIEYDEVAYQYHWYQAVLSHADGGFADGEYDDRDYFELEDMPSLALSANMLSLYPKIYSGEITLDLPSSS